jgi:Spy/CpxP family protein refolding chaperone
MANAHHRKSALEPIMNTQPTTTATESPPTRRRWFAGLAALGGLGLLGAAQAQGWGRGRLDPEERERRMEYRIGRMVQDVGGTPEQKSRLVAIMQAAIADMRPFRDQARQARRQGLDLLAAPTIDRPALERTRVAQMQAMDARSRRMLQAMADAADVLTPDQRVKLAERMKQRMDRGRS